MNYYVLSNNCSCFCDDVIVDVMDMSYEHYLEMQKFDKESKIKTEDTVIDEVTNLMENSDIGEDSQVDFIYIITLDESEVEPNAICVGYVAIEKNNQDSKLPDDVDYFIIDSYIDPQYRHRGLMSKAMIDYCYHNRGKYLYYVLSDNKIAIKFWQSLFMDKFKKNISIANEFNEHDRDNVTMFSVEV